MPFDEGTPKTAHAEIHIEYSEPVLTDFLDIMSKFEKIHHEITKGFPTNRSYNLHLIKVEEGSWNAVLVTSATIATAIGTAILAYYGYKNFELQKQQFQQQEVQQQQGPRIYAITNSPKVQSRVGILQTTLQTKPNIRRATLRIYDSDHRPIDIEL